MKFSLRTVSYNGKTYQCLAFVCPGCESSGNGTGLHMLPVNANGVTSPSWDWDGNIEAPTVSPSILTHTKPYVDGKGTGICHSYLKAGVFEFLDDCTHSMAGQHVTALELPEWFSDD